MVRPRYPGLATFMRAPYCEDLQGVDIGLIGVPFDGGVTNRTGTRLDPEQHETPPRSRRRPRRRP